MSQTRCGWQHELFLVWKVPRMADDQTIAGDCWFPTTSRTALRPRIRAITFPVSHNPASLPELRYRNLGQNPASVQCWSQTSVSTATCVLGHDLRSPLPTLGKKLHHELYPPLHPWVNLSSPDCFITCAAFLSMPRQHGVVTSVGSSYRLPFYATFTSPALALHANYLRTSVNLRCFQ